MEESPALAAANNEYPFGDNSRASARLRRLAEMYEPESRALLQRSGMSAPRLAVDLGCGPGWSTRLLQNVLKPGRTVGLDASAAYIEEAKARHGASLEFEVHDIAHAPFPVHAPDFLFSRFLLTHLRSLKEVLATWAGVAAPGAWLVSHETESLEAKHPALGDYYRMLDELQRHHGQILHVGALLEGFFSESGWRVVESQRVLLEKPARHMAGLHLANLRTWRIDEYAQRAFATSTVVALEASLERIASDREPGGIVINAARQIIARRA